MIEESLGSEKAKYPLSPHSFQCFTFRTNPWLITYCTSTLHTVRTCIFNHLYSIILHHCSRNKRRKWSSEEATHTCLPQMSQMILCQIPLSSTQTHSTIPRCRHAVKHICTHRHLRKLPPNSHITGECVDNFLEYSCHHCLFSMSWTISMLSREES